MSLPPDGHEWALLIQEAATERAVRAVVGAINAQTAAGRSNRAAVIVACAQVLAQNITAGSGVSSEVRAGIMALMDGYAMQSAIEEAEDGP